MYKNETILIPVYSDRYFIVKLKSIQERYRNSELLFFFTGSNEHFFTFDGRTFEHDPILDSQLESFLKRFHKCFRYDNINRMDLIYFYLIKYKSGLIVSDCPAYKHLIRWPDVKLLIGGKENTYQDMTNRTPYPINTFEKKYQIIFDF
jgi:hypothetical protein